MPSGDPHANGPVELIRAANQFLFSILPLRRVESRQAVDRFVAAIQHCPLSAPVRDAVLIRVLAVLQQQADGLRPGLVDRYLGSTALPGGHAMFESCVVDLLRHSGVDDPAVETAILFLKQHCREPDLSTGAIAAYVGMGLEELSHRFCTATRLRMTQYIRGLRLDAAAGFLATTEFSVKEVWAMAGYNHAANFCHEFRERFGINPTEYRAQVQKAPRSRHH